MDIYGFWQDNCAIDHGNGIQTLYAHYPRLLVRAGAQVNLGQVIASWQEVQELVLAATWISVSIKITIL